MEKLNFLDQKSYSFRIFSLLIDGISKDHKLYNYKHLLSKEAGLTDNFEVLRHLSIAGLDVTEHLSSCGREYNNPSNLQHLKDLYLVMEH